MDQERKPENDPKIDSDEEKPTTSPDEPTESATTPPSNPAVDEDAVRQARRDLERAGGGH